MKTVTNLRVPQNVGIFLTSWRPIRLFYVESIKSTDNDTQKQKLHYTELTFNWGYVSGRIFTISTAEHGVRGRGSKVYVCGRSLAEIVGSNPTGGMDCCRCCVLLGRGLCGGPITRPEESCQLWCVVVCDLETSWMRRPWPTGGGGAVAPVT